MPFRIGYEDVIFRVSAEQQTESGSWIPYGEPYTGTCTPDKKHPSADREYIYPVIKKAGSYRFKVTTLDIFLNESEATLISVPAYTSINDVIKVAVQNVALVLGILHVIAYTGLFISSRWSPKCLDLLNERVLQLVGLYIRPCIIYITPIRLWIFGLYFRNLQQGLHPGVQPRSEQLEHPYLAADLQGPEGTTLSSKRILQQLITNPYMWVQGKAGTGKSALVRHMMDLYAKQRSIEHAWRTFGYIPLWVNVRDHLSTSKIEQMARGALTECGMVLDDEAFFVTLLRHGRFLLILDGMNEAGAAESTLRNALQKFIIDFPTVRILVTSQSSRAQDGHFQEYELPPMNLTFARRLLNRVVPQ